MKTYLDCAPCFMRQALDTARMTTDDESVHEEVLRRVAREVSEMDMGLSPPAMGQKIHRLIRELTGDPDPYRAAKEGTNRLAMALYPEIRNRVRTASNPLEMAVRTAIAGNIFDFAIDSRIREEKFLHTMDRAATAPLHGDVAALAREAAAANLQQSAVSAPNGVLNVLQVRAPRPSGRKPHISQHLAGLATRRGEKCRLVAGP